MRTVALVLPLLVAGCASHQDNVCEDIGDCTQGGASSFIQNCKDEAKALESESSKVGCETPFDGYYACADTNFACMGATATFNGCDPALKALDDCLNAAQATTSCAALAKSQSSCTALPDAGGPALACTSGRDCEAHCYLANVSDVCAARVDELDAFQKCASACPP
jgi:hypothetical protein